MGQVENWQILLGIAILFVALFIDLFHSWARTGTVVSITEALGKLLVGSIMSLLAVGIVRRSFRGYMLILLFVLAFTIFAILAQALAYRKQRDKTRRYLRKLIKDKGGSDEVVEVVEELIDADFVPKSLGNTLSGNQRAETREIVAAWLNKANISVTTEELLVPKEKRIYTSFYRLLGFVVFVCAGIYISVFYLTSEGSTDPTSNTVSDQHTGTSNNTNVPLPPSSNISSATSNR